MPDGFTDAMSAIQAGLQQLPPVVIVIGMLFGPTLAWFGYRSYRSPKSTVARVDGPELYWICRECRSANQPRARHCYLCGLDGEQETEPISVLDHGAIVEFDAGTSPSPVIEEEAAPPLVAVGPGRDPAPAPPSLRVVGGSSLDDVGEVAPDVRPRKPAAPKAKKPRRAAATATAKRPPTRRDAAS